MTYIHEDVGSAFFSVTASLHIPHEDRRALEQRIQAVCSQMYNSPTEAASAITELKSRIQLSSEDSDRIDSIVSRTLFPPSSSQPAAVKPEKRGVETEEDQPRKRQKKQEESEATSTTTSTEETEQPQVSKKRRAEGSPDLTQEQKRRTPHPDAEFFKEEEVPVHSLETLLREAHIPQPDLEKILKYSQQGWEGAYRESKTSPGFLEQTHHIRGLKVHRNKNGKIVADIAIKPVGAGFKKAVKALCRITPSGEVKLLVRYHAPGKISKTGEKIEVNQKVLAFARFQAFFKDIQNELKVRERLQEKWRQKLGKKIGEKIEEIPNLLKIKESGTYVGKRLNIKRRFTAERCEGAVSDLVYRSGNAQEVDTPLPEESQQKGKALFCILGAINGLRQMHEFGFVHKDVKDGNFFVADPKQKLKTLLQSHPQLTPEEKAILFQRCSQKGVIIREPLPVELQNILCELYTQCGLVGDFGFCAHVSDLYIGDGTPAYLAPEINDPRTMHNNPKMDIFSLGATLLAIYNPKLSSELTQLNGQMCRLRKPFLTLEEYHSKLDELRKRLGDRPDSNALEVLISDTLNFEPEKRPNVAEVQQRFEAALKALLEKKEIFV